MLAEVCRQCRRPTRLEKTIWSTNRPPVHVFVCDPCERTYLVAEDKVALEGVLPQSPTLQPT